MNKLLNSLVTGLALLASVVSPVFASDTTTKVTKVVTCVEQYGGGKVCGETTDEEIVVHEPIDTALGDVNPVILTAAGLSAAGLLFYLSKRTQEGYVLEK
jgi:hypothetical protein